MALSSGLPALWEAAPSREEADAAREASFRLSLNEEHLDDIGSLYYQREYLLGSTEAEFDDLAACEQRLLNHADAAAMGGELALSLAASYTERDDPADIFAGAFVLGMVNAHECIDRLRAAWEAIEDEEQLSALSVACRLAPHPRLAEMLDSFLDHERPLVREKALAALGGRAEISVDSLRKSLEDEDVIVRVEATRHVIHGDGSVVPWLARGLHHDSPLVRTAAAEGLLVLGRREGLEFCRWRLREEPAAEEVQATARLLALAGSSADFPLIEAAWCDVGGSSELAEAFGLLGDVRALKILVQGLQHEEAAVRHGCAAALERITGAGLLRGDLATEEEEEKEEREEQSETQDSKAAAPTAALAAEANDASGRAPPADDPGHSYDVWFDHCRVALSRWDRSMRYRRGEPYHPSRLVAALSERLRPRAERELLHRELVLRTGQRLPLSTGDFLALQHHQVEAWRNWLRTGGARFPAGAWTFAGVKA